MGFGGRERALSKARQGVSNGEGSTRGVVNESGACRRKRGGSGEWRRREGLGGGAVKDEKKESSSQATLSEQLRGNVATWIVSVRVCLCVGGRCSKKGGVCANKPKRKAKKRRSKTR